MQNVFNTVKSKALGVAEYLTPVLKVLCDYAIDSGLFSLIIT